MPEIFESKFDSDALGIPVAKLLAPSLTRVELDHSLQNAAKKGFRLLFWSTAKEHASALEAHARSLGHYCSSKVMYTVYLNESLLSALQHSTETTCDCDVVELPGTNPSAELLELSLQAGKDSRFMNDPNLSHQQFERVYCAWMENSVKSSAADVVLTAKVSSQLVGAVTVKSNSEQRTSSIVLLAVHPDYRRLGIAKTLVLAAFRWSLAQGFAACNIVTPLANTKAQTLCKKCGGMLVSTSTDFHFWLPTTPFNDPVTSRNIPGNKPHVTGGEIINLEEVFSSEGVATHGKFGQLCQEHLESNLGALKALLVTSGTAALELCSLAIKTNVGDEIIMPTYTFVSTATAFVNHGGVPVFVDIRSDTQNIDETKIESAITERTKAIVVVHYAGIPCEMDTILDIAKRHNLFVIEDNAHGIFSTYKGKPLGTIGHLGAHSFHYTKNLSCGEGGAVLINSPDLVCEALVAWEKGTNRFDFLAGKVDKYAWVDKGSSFILSEINAAVLAAQLDRRAEIFAAREHVWNCYFSRLQPLKAKGKLLLPHVPPECKHNSHIFYIRVLNPDSFEYLGQLSKQRGIGMFTHYIPLHMSTGGKQYGRAHGSLVESVNCNAQLYRLPLWPDLTDLDVDNVVSLVFDAFGEKEGQNA